MGQGQVAGCCESGDEYSGFIRCGVFIDWLMNDELLKDYALWGWLVSQSVSQSVCLSVVQQANLNS